MPGVPWVATDAEVEWRSGSRGFEEPVALRFGTRRVAVRVEERWAEGALVGGAPVRRVFVVRDAGAVRWRVAVDDEGITRVECGTA